MKGHSALQGFYGPSDLWLLRADIIEVDALSGEQTWPRLVLVANAAILVILPRSQKSPARKAGTIPAQNHSSMMLTYDRQGFANKGCRVCAILGEGKT